MSSNKPHTSIGTLSEYSLHAKLKEVYSQPSDELEADVEGYVADILRNDHVIEVQTKQIAAIREKVIALVKNYQVTIVHPISIKKWIIKESIDGKEILSRRKSPLKKNIYHLFNELVHVPFLLTNRGIKLEVVLIHEEEVRRHDGKGSWKRKGWSIHDRRLLKIVEKYQFSSPRDLLGLLPMQLSTPFTNRELATLIKVKIGIAQKMTYTLRKMGFIRVAGRKGRSYLHVFA
ncbi:MAG: hypothetical protein GF411_19095 [Candidatus Lokiarchaeota archaeon]|nr:hypothetical protein [Candidatus Lokiarchaeota archaeon]